MPWCSPVGPSNPGTCQCPAGNWLVMTIALLLLVGFIYGAVQLVSWRLSNGAEMPSGAGSFTQRAIEPASAVARL